MCTVYADANGEVFMTSARTYLAVSASGWSEEFDSFDQAFAWLSCGF